MKFKGVVNFADMRQKQEFLGRCGALNDSHELSIKPFRPRRSLRANAYYWAAVIPAFQQFAAEQGDDWDKETCHEIIVRNTLGETTAIVKSTGEVLAKVRRPTHTLNSEEFSRFVDQAIAWLGDYGIYVPPPEQFYEPKERKSSCHPITV